MFQSWLFEVEKIAEWYGAHHHARSMGLCDESR